MAYLGKTPSQAVRQRYYFTASGGETSLSGADDNGNTLTFTDGAYVDVYLNGVLLVAGTDYNTSTANTIGGLTALSASDVVELVVYDTFAVFGGEVQGDFNVSNGGFTATQDSTNPVTINRTTSDGDIAVFQKDGTTVGAIGNRSDSFYIRTESGTNGSGLRLSDGYFIPCASDGSGSDASTDLGLPNTRFKDLYLAGDIAHKDAAGNARLLYDKSENLLGNAGTYLYGYGVYLGGTDAANLLDDVEYGTWSPVYRPSSGAFSTLTMDINSATYLKIKNHVYLNAYIRTNNVVVGTASGALTIGGLPFASNVSYGQFVSTYHENWGGTTPSGGYAALNQNFIQLQTQPTAGGAHGTSNVTDLTTGASSSRNRLIITGFYITNA
jgi:hypothetical protein